MNLICSTRSKTLMSNSSARPNNIKSIIWRIFQRLNGISYGSNSPCRFSSFLPDYFQWVMNTALGVWLLVAIIWPGRWQFHIKRCLRWYCRDFNLNICSACKPFLPTSRHVHLPGLTQGQRLETAHSGLKFVFLWV